MWLNLEKNKYKGNLKISNISPNVQGNVGRSKQQTSDRFEQNSFNEKDIKPSTKGLIFIILRISSAICQNRFDRSLASKILRI